MTQRGIMKRFSLVKNLGAFLSLALTVLLIGPVWAQGAGDLIVSPTRVVFEGRDRSAQVTLANRGSESTVFRISLLDMAMDDQGQIHQMQDGAKFDRSAAKLVRYAPRQISLKPGATQIVRLSLRKPADLADGEYRSHMFFRAVPPESAGRSVADETPLAENELRIQLTPIYGITIPVIVRQGDASPKMEITAANIIPAEGNQGLRIDATFNRGGLGSAFGNVIATYSPAGGGEPLVIGEITRLAVYPEVSSRRVVMPLRLPESVQLSKGKIDLIYRELEKDGGKTMASRTIQVN